MLRLVSVPDPLFTTLAEMECGAAKGIGSFPRVYTAVSAASFALMCLSCIWGLKAVAVLRNVTPGMGFVVMFPLLEVNKAAPVSLPLVALNEEAPCKTLSFLSIISCKLLPAVRVNGVERSKPIHPVPGIL